MSEMHPVYVRLVDDTLLGDILMYENSGRFSLNANCYIGITSTSHPLMGLPGEEMANVITDMTKVLLTYRPDLHQYMLRQLIGMNIGKDDDIRPECSG